jgi:uncharacterized membrane protein YqaE (UPF0057 family)
MIALLFHMVPGIISPLVSVVMQSDCPSAALKIEILLTIIKAIDKNAKTSDIPKMSRCEISFHFIWFIVIQ